ncbi:MAG: vitamin K epoxide reductase family protein [bacterium]|nr:vitamin K epoxide reductase family protein [bacterium]
MKILKELLTKPFQKPVNKGIVIFLIAVAAVGFFDAAYLTIQHFMNVIPPCTIDGCETVLASAYAEVAGVPVALLGAVYYLSIMVLLIAYLDSKKEALLRWALAITALGFLASIYFFILQAWVIKAYCQYCLLSATTSTILFITAIAIFKKAK